MYGIGVETEEGTFLSFKNGAFWDGGGLNDFQKNSSSSNAKNIPIVDEVSIDACIKNSRK